MSEVELIHSLTPTLRTVKIKDYEKRLRRESLGKKTSKKEEKKDGQKQPSEHIDEYA